MLVTLLTLRPLLVLIHCNPLFMLSSAQLLASKKLTDFKACAHRPSFSPAPRFLGIDSALARCAGCCYPSHPLRTSERTSLFLWLIFVHFSSQWLPWRRVLFQLPFPTDVRDSSPSHPLTVFELNCINFGFLRLTALHAHLRARVKSYGTCSSVSATAPLDLF